MVNNYRDALEVPRKRKIRWILITVALFVFGVLLDYLFLHLVFNEKTFQNNGSEIQPIPAPPAVESALGGPAETSSAVVNSEKVEKFKAEIAKCFGTEGPLASSATTDQLVEELMRANPSVKTTHEVENIHVRGKDGNLKRMQLIDADPNQGKSIKELRYYSADKDGMPVLIPLPDDKRINPSAEYLNSLKSEGSVVFHQLKEKRTLKDGSEISLNIINNHVYEFELFGKAKSLSCRELDCNCR